MHEVWHTHGHKIYELQCGGYRPYSIACINLEGERCVLPATCSFRSLPHCAWNTYLALLKVTPDFGKFSPVCSSFENMAPPTLKNHCSVSRWSRVKLADQQSFPLIQQSLFSLLSTSYWFPSIRLSSSNLPFSLESLPPPPFTVLPLSLCLCDHLLSPSIISPISDI